MSLTRYSGEHVSFFVRQPIIDPFIKHSFTCTYIYIYIPFYPLLTDHLKVNIIIIYHALLTLYYLSIIIMSLFLTKMATERR